MSTIVAPVGVGNGVRVDQAPHAVALLVSLTLGVGVLMRGEASHDEIAAHFQAAHAVSSWRVPA